MRAGALVLTFSLLAIALTAPATARADDDTSAADQAKRDGRAVGQGTRDAAVSFGHGVGRAATAVGHGVRDTAIEVSHGVANGAHVVGAGVSSAWDGLTGKADTGH